MTPGGPENDQETYDRRVPPVLPQEEPRNRETKKSRDLRNACSGGTARKGNPVLQKAMTRRLGGNDGPEFLESDLCHGLLRESLTGLSLKNGLCAAPDTSASGCRGRDPRLQRQPVRRRNPDTGRGTRSRLCRCLWCASTDAQQSRAHTANGRIGHFWARCRTL